MDGSFVAGTGQSLQAVNPANEDVLTEVDTSGLEQFEAAISGARRSFDEGEWSGAGRSKRADAILAMADHFESNYSQLCNTVIAEVGASQAMCDGVQVRQAITQMRELVDLYMQLPEEEHNPRPIKEIAASGKVTASVIRYEPVGVVAAISAYNFPFWINMWKAIPPLLTGSSVILRPSPLTPLSALAFADAAVKAGVPRGVFNVLVEEGIEGSHLLTTHPDVDMVTFTGSSTVGKLIAAQAAGTVKKVALELGGKSVQIYLPDAIERRSLRLHVGVPCTRRAGLCAADPDAGTRGPQGRGAREDGRDSRWYEGR